MPIETKVRILKKRRTKIVATLGPASSSVETIAELIEAGVDVFRLNMSHGDHDGHRQAYHRIREAGDRSGRPVAILADLCGPKIRVGTFRGGSIEISDGERVTVTTEPIEGESGLIPSQYAALAHDVRPGDRILLADGTLELRVESVQAPTIETSVVHGGTLSDRKGINLPGVEVSAPSLTDKDREDARFALELGVDFLALSFVRRASDIHDLRSLMKGASPQPLIVAKIEKPEALERIEEILDATDAIMVARGDLGVELPPEEVPVAQDLLVDYARRRNCPVIVATQMLESMIEQARPTRAEVSDVSHAVASGTDAVMLSAETAAGEHPVLAVEMMDRIARQTEAHLWRSGGFGSITEEDEGRIQPPIPTPDAVSRATSLLSRDLEVRSIVVLSATGVSARSVTAGRPSAPILAATTDPITCRQIALLWGAVPLLVKPEEFERPETLARRLALDLGLAPEGEHILLVRGFHRESPRNHPSITVLRV